MVLQTIVAGILMAFVIIIRFTMGNTKCENYQQEIDLKKQKHVMNIIVICAIILFFYAAAHSAL